MCVNMPTKTEKTPKKPSEYIGVSIPAGLIKLVDEIVSSEKYGYASRADFVCDAVRKRLGELGYLK